MEKLTISQGATATHQADGSWPVSLIPFFLGSTWRAVMALQQTAPVGSLPPEALFSPGQQCTPLPYVDPLRLRAPVTSCDVV
ncbi:hypothetical protein PAL_GLEAN10002988 [Pteropus alecto]|uniref:Uncharacterized protein n=1 Tax=Pteropus alecto TaxID=9402 RepID=L5JVX6_PTEAL|nr:hypothetical protein PAL_GLEAN10002988 [Pteropus alecto]